ncbi:MAG: universal stress protein [Algoriphagus sp.]|jgi:nucleotide-binding universal stress UspA family protein|uniref:universal stress protein n=1 Tax=Algoriphagus sp. TaxID=1872435 RepID=UPI002746B4FA|nr:universal stress protein [Algoriphagus sp.]MDP4839359.1 universal stress protein [Algoriphagus sp.]MDP4957130.1 universal stress protein [Algoriphagus sp.]
MYPIKKMIVCLDQSPLDQTLIAFAGAIAKVNQVKKIYFTNVIKNFGLPKEMLEEFPDLIEKMVGERRTAMENTVNKYLDPQKGLEVSFVVKEGNLSKKILKLAEEKSVDLILLGKKATLVGTGVASQRMARRATCSLLLVPEDAKPKFTRLLVPSDFSEHSKTALEEGILWAKKQGLKTELFFQNVFTIPSGYYFTGKSLEEFTDQLKAHAAANFKKFIRKIDTKGIKITPIYTPDQDDNPIQEIVATALAQKADVILIGAKGNTASTALHIGSLAERLIQYNNRVPLLVSRPKGKNAGVLDYLLEI